MAVHATLHLETYLPVTLTAPGLSEEEFLGLCEEFPDAAVEYSADGVVTILPPTDPETGKRTSELIFQLKLWARTDGRGSATGTDTGFFLRNGARRSPDAAWFSEARWQEALRRSTGRFPVFVPEFVIELRSPNDCPAALRANMQEYLSNGALLGWLIDRVQKSVTIYRLDREPETIANPESVRGEGPVEGFELSIKGIF